jgi:hypothetical protein
MLRKEHYLGEDEDAPPRSMKRVEEMGELRDFLGERGLSQFYDKVMRAKVDIPDD